LTGVKRLHYSAARMPRQSPKPLTVPEAAKRIHRTPAALYAAIKRGDLRATEEYGRKLIAINELRRYKRDTKTGRPQNGVS
jgi:hypothetical protein